VPARAHGHVSNRQSDRDRVHLRLVARGLAAAIAAAAGGVNCSSDANGPSDSHVAVDAGADAADATPDGTTDQTDGPGNDAGPTQPRIIQVTTFAVDDVADGKCSLREAIAAATLRPSGNDDCPTGTGNDVIELGAGTYTASAGLEITGTVAIRGAGRDATTVSFAGLPSGCAVSIAQGSTDGASSVVISGLTLTQTTGTGAPMDVTGACVTAGRLRVRDARVTGFTAGGLAALAATGDDAVIEILKSMVDGNMNRGNGGGVAFTTPGSSIWIAESAIVNNTSSGMGGGVFASGGTNACYISNTTISGNHAWRGGGVAALIPSLTYLGLYWSTIVGNRASDTGGGLYLQAAGEAAHTLVVGDIVTDNVAAADATQGNLNADWTSDVLCTFSLLYAGGLARWPAATPAGSCMYDVADAKLGPLLDMGGANHLPLHPLLPGSPAIDAVDAANSIEPLEQRDTWNMGAGDPPLGTGPGQTPPWVVWGRGGDGDPLNDMGAYEFSPRWEVELLTVADVSASGHEVVADPTGWSHGAGTHLQARGPDEYVTYEVPVPEAGAYAISLRLRATSDSGKATLSIADNSTGSFVPLGASFDGYAPADDWRTVTVGTVAFAAAGKKAFRFTVTGNNEASSGYDLFLDDLEVTKQ